MFESKAGVLFVGGLGFFFFAFVSNALVPMFMYQELPEQPVSELTNANLMYEFEDLERRWPEQFQAAFGSATKEKCAEALELGRQIYIGEGCWHCHSQFVRPVSNESLRFGPVAKSEEFQNALQRPVMFGTRRVGPDLSREGGRPLLPPADRFDRFADARLSLVFRWCRRQTDAPRTGDHDVCAVARIVVGKLSLLRRISTGR
jgi:hypothetical protein